MASKKTSKTAIPQRADRILSTRTGRIVRSRPGASAVHGNAPAMPLKPEKSYAELAKAWIDSDGQSFNAASNGEVIDSTSRARKKEVSANRKRPLPADKLVAKIQDLSVERPYVLDKNRTFLENSKEENKHRIREFQRESLLSELAARRGQIETMCVFDLIIDVPSNLTMMQDPLGAKIKDWWHSKTPFGTNLKPRIHLSSIGTKFDSISTLRGFGPNGEVVSGWNVTFEIPLGSLIGVLDSFYKAFALELKHALLTISLPEPYYVLPKINDEKNGTPKKVTKTKKARTSPTTNSRGKRAQPRNA